MAIREKVKLKTYFHPPTGRTKKQEDVLALKEIFKSYKTKINYIIWLSDQLYNFPGIPKSIRRRKKTVPEFCRN